MYEDDRLERYYEDRNDATYFTPPYVPFEDEEEEEEYCEDCDTLQEDCTCDEEDEEDEWPELGEWDGEGFSLKPYKKPE
jgi:hypothetical protein